jgi:cytochrome c oxidase subunit 3
MLKNTPSSWPGRPDLYRVKLAFYLFVATLAILFVSCFILFVFVRLTSDASLSLPTAVWPALIVLLLLSGCLHLASRCMQREQQRPTRALLLAAMVLGIAFFGLQGSALVQLLAETANLGTQGSRMGKVAFVLVFLHALHAVGGMLGLAIVTLRAWRRRYDHEHHVGIDICAGYWHFLDVIWIIMLLMFLWPA